MMKISPASCVSFPFLYFLLLDVIATTTDDKKGVDRSSTVIARDATEGRFLHHESRFEKIALITELLSCENKQQVRSLLDTLEA